MSAFTGAEAVAAGAGTVAFTGGTLLNVINIRLTREKTLHETTDNTMVERVHRTGLGSSNGTFDAFHDTDNPPLAEGTTGTLTFTAYTGRVYTILIVIENYSVDWKTDGTCDVTYTWRQSGTGASTDFSRT